MRREYDTADTFWVLGYFASTAGALEVRIRAYIKKQKREDARLHQLRFLMMNDDFDVVRSSFESLC
jgi:hypothetical protein